MYAEEPWKSLGWRHSVWDLLRYYCSIRGKQKKQEWVNDLNSTLLLSVDDNAKLPLNEEDVRLFVSYLEYRDKQENVATYLLRSEDEALEYCTIKGIQVSKTTTMSKDHHQSSKALIAAVSNIAERVSKAHGTTVESNPQTRCVWCTGKHLHVTARNLDGAIPELTNPVFVWEIKEYWGKTKGGSKMSDAVYECNLVGRELKEFEERSGIRVYHIVFVDGKAQWSYRKSDLARFLDLTNQGLIDYLFVGREVEIEWEPTLTTLFEQR